MTTILWITLFGLLMSLIALAGGLFLFLQPALVDKLILPLIAFAAGSLIGGAMFHMIPHAVDKMGNELELYGWLMAGFTLFLGLEQFLNWHHSHTHSHNCSPFSDPLPDETSSHPAEQQGTVEAREGQTTTQLFGGESRNQKKPGDLTSSNPGETDIEDYDCVEAGSNSTPESDSSENAHTQDNNETINSPERKEQRRSLGYLILLADAVHNFLGGLFVGATFVDSTSLGVSSWTAAAFHEVPQELGDFAILVHGGWSKKGALLCNFLSALTFPLGGIVAYVSSRSMDISFLIPFAAGNFLYIGATDLIPEIKHHHGIRSNVVHFGSFVFGAAVLFAIRIAVDGM